MRVTIQKTGETTQIDHAGSAASLLALLGVNPETVLIVKDGTLITAEDAVDDAKKIELLSVISGG